VILGRVSCLTHWIVTLSSSTRIINAAVSPMCSTQQQCKTVEICTKQSVVIEFLTADSSIPVHLHLRSVCGDNAIDVSSVRYWVCCFKSLENDIGDRPTVADQPQQ